jgi:hypothetical protein
MLRKMASTRESGIFEHGKDRDHALADCRSVGFVCPRGHQFAVRFSRDADLPASWECRKHGSPSRRVDVTPGHKQVKKREPWDMLQERRSMPELETLLAEQLQALRAGRLVPVTAWLTRSQGERSGQLSATRPSRSALAS